MKKLSQKAFKSKRAHIFADCCTYDDVNYKKIRDEEKRQETLAKMLDDIDINFDTDTGYKVLGDMRYIYKNQDLEEKKEEDRKEKRIESLMQRVFDIVVYGESGEYTEKDIKGMCYDFVISHCKI